MTTMTMQPPGSAQPAPAPVDGPGVRVSFAALGGLSIIVGLLAGAGSAMVALGVSRGQAETRLTTVEARAEDNAKKLATMGESVLFSRERQVRIEAIVEATREDLKRVDAKLDRALERREGK